jgi:hypothetical protein
MAHLFKVETLNRNRGGIAQLVERLLCKQDVSGSSPLISREQISTISKMDAEQMFSKNLENCIEKNR